MYALLFRVVFSRMDAERAHHLVVPVLRILGVWPFRSLARLVTRPRTDVSRPVLGLDFATPFGVAAGFDKNAKLVPGLAALGFGHVEIGTVTARPQPGNPKPRLFRLLKDRALINRMGFNNDGAEVVATRLARLRRRADRAVIGVNIGKSRVVDVEHATADYVESTRRLAPLADYLVVNVSSPNTPGLRGLQAVETLRPLLTAVRESAGETPLLVKIAPDLPDDEVRAIAQMAVEERLAGIIATNTTISRDGLVTDSAAVETMGAGGLSGAPLRERSFAVLQVLRAAVPAEFVVISAGGVETADDVRARLDAGADLVQGYTGFIYRGPLWAREVNRGI